MTPRRCYIKLFFNVTFMFTICLCSNDTSRNVLPFFFSCEKLRETALYTEKKGLESTPRVISTVED